MRKGVSDLWRCYQVGLVWRSCHRGGGVFVVDGAEVPEGGVAAAGAVEGFDPVEDRSGEPGASGRVVAVEQLALERREEAFGYSVGPRRQRHPIGLVTSELFG
jgi:hypothetical protein